ncbi:PREDICTED: uncharacterized protein LOC101300154 [Fragaria vesca subsp. vesca]
MVEQYENTLGSCLEIQNATGSTALRQAVLQGNVDVVKELVPFMRKEGLEIQDADGDTPINCALLSGNVGIAKELVQSMRQEEALEDKDAQGVTALNWAIQCFKDGDVYEIAKKMAGINDQVLGIPSGRDDGIPVVNALRWKKWESVRYLYSVTPPELLNGPNGSAFICYCLDNSKQNDLAWDLLRHYPYLAMTMHEKLKTSPMLKLSRMRYAFLSGSQLTRWQRWIYNREYS